MPIIGQGGHGGATGGGGGMMNQLEKATHMDLNGDGRVGGGMASGQQYGQQQGQHYGQQYGQPSGGGGGMGGGFMNQLEKATHMDLNGDGRVSGQSSESKPIRTLLIKQLISS